MESNFSKDEENDKGVLAGVTMAEEGRAVDKESKESWKKR